MFLLLIRGFKKLCEIRYTLVFKKSKFCIFVAYLFALLNFKKFVTGNSLLIMTYYKNITVLFFTNSKL